MIQTNHALLSVIENAKNVTMYTWIEEHIQVF